MSNDRVSWSIIRSRYGDEVVRYLKHQDAQPEKIAFRVYKVLHIDILNQCARIATTLREKCWKEPPMKKRRINGSSDSDIESNCYHLSDSVKRVVNVDLENSSPKKDVSEVQVTNLPITVNLLICLDSLYKQTNRMPELDFLSLKKFRPSWNYEKVFHCIMQTYIGRQKAIKYDACFKDIKLVLEKFRNRHNKFKYSACLETIMKMKNQSEKNAAQVSVHQLQQYFYTVSVCVVPIQLFGSNANLKKLRRGLRQYFLSSWKETVSLKSYVMSMDISCITWLKSIPDVEARWLIIAKLARWLFEVYFLGILETIFRVQKDLYSEKKFFLSSLRWKKWTYYCIKTLERKKALVRKSLVADFPENKFITSGTICNFYPKENGVRCVYVFRMEQSQRDNLMMLKLLLQQLYSQEYGSATIKKLYPIWSKLVQKKHRNPDHPFFLVSSDIVDAYGSVIQTRLYDILHGMIMEIPGDKITLEWLAILKPNIFCKKNRVKYIQWFSCCSSLPRIPAHSLISLAQDDEHKSKFISKKKVCFLLKTYILQQTVSYRDTEYIIKKGLPQGFLLSPILSDIYYAHMTKQDFGIFKKSGLLMRYVDDFLYITDEEDAAEKFMQKIKIGAPEYNCRFKTSKTQTNLILEGWKSTKCVTYLGHRINCATLEVSPILADLEFRHSKSMQCIKYRNDRSNFAMRLRNFAALKLSPIVLDPKINSFATICSTIQSVARTMASRCAVLISKMFQKCELYVSEIWEEIERVVKILAEIFVTHLSRSRDRLSAKVIRYIKTLIWKSFYEVFAKDTNLRQCFGDSIRRMINNLLAV